MNRRLDRLIFTVVFSPYTTTAHLMMCGPRTWTWGLTSPWMSVKLVDSSRLVMWWSFWLAGVPALDTPTPCVSSQCRKTVKIPLLFIHHSSIHHTNPTPAENTRPVDHPVIFFPWLVSGSSSSLLIGWCPIILSFDWLFSLVLFFYSSIISCLSHTHMKPELSVWFVSCLSAWWSAGMGGECSISCNL